MAQDNNDFTLEDILAEQRAKRELQEAEKAAAPQPQGRPAGKPAPKVSQAPAKQRQAPAKSAPAPKPAAPKPQASAPAEDLNSFATGSVELPLRKEDQPAPAPEKQEKPGKKKKKGFGLFSRKKRMPDFDENEDDMYYGIHRRVPHGI